ncbi:hypothetical protein AADC60_15685 [Cytobacillus pseudoceanisediminis]|jgi:uncharacterized membrane protein SirB2|uniref:Uncharacterized protein n=3 Tax=Cytobacillus TaxID=2675230 RepID=A0ABX3CZP5_9BACI|nr:MULTISPECIES: hypothetical protein [Cytobacillus]MBY0155669.1 hypothetical protein [Cytobacillus firmus]MCM3532516.1 hypothetical protein [Cytobacillus oceanisediminis]OHX50592.1 hypothetical protein BBV17_06100 [Cytobacillus oceanisediminis]QOK29061.1 hypothetical protein IIE26_10550 [Cytobacillus oceanisediminis]
MEFVYLLSIIVAIMFISISFFQVLLSLGYPLGEYAMGGYYKVLPKKLRIVSVINAIILLFMGFVFLQHTDVLSGFDFLPTNILVWVFTIFLGFNTIANLISRSEKERLIMTPLSGITFILCLFITLS